MSFTYLSVLSHASLRVIAIVREADGEKEATAVLYFIHIFTEMRGRCKEIDGGKIIMGFSSITGIPDRIFTAASTRYSFFLLFICLFFSLSFIHPFISSGMARTTTASNPKPANTGRNIALRSSLSRRISAEN